MTRPPSRQAAFRAALRAWHATEAKSAPPALVNHAIAACRELEAEALAIRQQAQARARAAMSAIDAGRLDEARAALRRMLDETIENDARR